MYFDLQILFAITTAVETHKAGVEQQPVHSQYSLLSMLPRPWLQPCCNFPYCRCADDKRTGADDKRTDADDKRTDADDKRTDADNKRTDADNKRTDADDKRTDATGS